MIWDEADIIMVQLDLLKRQILAKENDPFWMYVHPLISWISQDKFNGDFYADAVESALKAVNSRVSGKASYSCKPSYGQN